MRTGLKTGKKTASQGVACPSGQGCGQRGRGDKAGDTWAVPQHRPDPGTPRGAGLREVWLQGRSPTSAAGLCESHGGLVGRPFVSLCGHAAASPHRPLLRQETWLPSEVTVEVSRKGALVRKLNTLSGMCRSCKERKPGPQPVPRAQSPSGPSGDGQFHTCLVLPERGEPVRLGSQRHMCRVKHWRCPFVVTLEAPPVHSREWEWPLSPFLGGRHILGGASLLC